MLKPPENKIFEKRLCLSEDELLQYASGKMSERENHHVEKHITDCELCNDALEGLLLMKNKSAIGLYKKEILDSLVENKNILKRTYLKTYWLAAAAIIAVVILSGIYFQFVDKKNSFVNELAVLPEKNQKELLIQDQQFMQAQKENSIPGRNKTVITESEKNNSSDDKAVSAFGEAEGAMQSTTGLRNEMKDSVVSAYGSRETSTIISREEENKNGIALSEVVADESEKQMNEVNIAPSSAKNLETAGNYPASTDSKRSEAKILMKSDDSENIDNTLSKIYSEIENKKYDAALKKLNDLKNSYPGNLSVIYYSGLANYFMNDYNKAIDNFNIILNVPENSLYDDARWYKVLALVKMNDKKAARIILAKIIGEKSSFQKQAEKMLEQIDGN